jgi:hypothetical protein
VPVLVVAFALAAYGVYHESQAKQERYEKRMSIAQLASRNVPDIARYEPYGGELAEFEPIANALDVEDCATAGDLARRVRERIGPMEWILRLEVESYVCAGNGVAAVEAIEAAPKFDDLWLTAQARMLRGDAEIAMDLLRDAVGTDQGPAALNQLDRVQEIWRQ